MDKERKSNLAKKFTIYLFYASLLLFFIAFNFRDNPGGWQLQYLTDLNGAQINDVIFLDSLTGFIATNPVNNTSCIFKTTNGGNNWVAKKSNNLGYPYGYVRIIFCNSLIGYSNSYDSLFKTTNGGENWLAIPFPTGISADDMFALNKDTLWIAFGLGLTGGLFRSTNGGLNWIQQFYQFNQNPDKIYMVNKNLGFIKRGDTPFGGYVGRTTDGGFNWILTYMDTVFNDMHFIDSMTGWRAGCNILKTTNGGLNWSWQKLPNLNITYNLMLKFSFANKDTAYGIGGVIHYPTCFAGLLYKTTNGGINWGYQIPDTNFGIGDYYFIDFINKNNGWAFWFSNKAIHTVTGGGDTTFYTGINNITQIPPKNFELKQNYPNPYNNSTLIEYYINESGWVKLKIFDITGREMATLVNEVQSTGGYGMPVSVQLSSGVYFYKLVYTNKKGEMQMDVKKMVLLK